MADYGIKITTSGKDVTSTDERDYVLWSKYPFMKTYMVGTVSYTFSSDVDSVDIDISHNENERKVIWLSIEGAGTTEKTCGRWFDYVDSGGNKNSRWWDGQGMDNKLRIHYGEQNFAGGGYDPTGDLKRILAR